jgi:hypothetical protein
LTWSGPDGRGTKAGLILAAAGAAAARQRALHFGGHDVHGHQVAQDYSADAVKAS